MIEISQEPVHTRRAQELTYGKLDVLNWQRFCEVVIELYYQEVRLVLDNIYMRICLAPTHVTDQGLPI